MTDHHDIVARTEEFVFDLFKRKLPEYLVYHTYAHTEAVAKSARKLAEDTELGEEGIEVVALASLLHDTGYTELYKGHEEVSIRIATEYLHREGYPEDKIDVVVGCIRATRIPQTPRNILEEIVADADLSSLGKKSFFEQSELLRIEWERAQGRHYTDEEWREQSIDLLSKHTYFTRAAQERYASRQLENLRRLYKEKAERTTPSEPPQSVVVHETPPVAHSDQSALLVMSDNAIRLIALANRKAQFFLVANFVILLILANDALREGHTSVFGAPYVLFTPAFLLSFFSAVRTLFYRATTTLGTADQDRLRSDVAKLERTLSKKEATNQWVLRWFVLGMVVGILTHLLIRLYPNTFLSSHIRY